MPIAKELRDSDRLFLDTHVFIWLLEGSDELRPVVVSHIETAREKDALFISAISFWEIAMLAKKGRVRLKAKVEDMAKLVAVSPLDVAVLVQSCEMSDFETHGDPADRMIMAGAIQEKSILLTRDRVINQIAKKSRKLKVFKI